MGICVKSQVQDISPTDVVKGISFPTVGKGGSQGVRESPIKYFLLYIVCNDSFFYLYQLINERCDLNSQKHAKNSEKKLQPRQLDDSLRHYNSVEQVPT